jgi:hypothetical protein
MLELKEGYLLTECSIFPPRTTVRAMYQIDCYILKQNDNLCFYKIHFRIKNFNLILNRFLSKRNCTTSLQRKFRAG